MSLELKECYENINQMFEDNQEKEKKLKILLETIEQSNKEKNKLRDESLKLNQLKFQKEKEVEFLRKEKELRLQENLELNKMITELKD